MNIDILLQNVVSLFVIAVIIEASVMAVFSMSSLREMSSKRPVEATRDALIFVLAFFLCYKIETFSVFKGTGIAIPRLMDVVISALVLMRLTNFVWNFMSRFRREE
ncbi:MAG: hypothetical protein EPN93_02855 [Spirochaetes bacterium]|nr:MAG: hypothetical protein EPN93_02855 [Spirochaetota bacterium]